jgi:hypothetical protein
VDGVAPPCEGLSRLIALCLRCHVEGLQRRYVNQISNCVAALCRDMSPTEAATFAGRHHERFYQSLKRLDGVWLPHLLPSKDTTFFWDRSSTPWKFSLKAVPEAQEITMSGLLGLIQATMDEPSRTDPPRNDPLVAGNQPVASVSLPNPRGVPDPAPRVSPRGRPGPAEQESVASLSLKVAALGQKLDMLLDLVSSDRQQRMVSEAGQSASHALNQARARVEVAGDRERGPAPSAGFWNPATTFSMVNNDASNGNMVVAGQGALDGHVIQELARAGFSAAEIVAAVGRAPAAPVMEHRAAWMQVTQGTSPLSVFTAMDSEARESATPKTLNVQTYDATGAKLSAKVMAWPAASPDAVPPFKFVELGQEWKRALVQANQQMWLITPPADRGSVPVLPVDVDKFLAHCLSCLNHYTSGNVMRAWNATHNFVVDEYIRKRSTPVWDTVWMLPVFHFELNKTPSAMGASQPTPQRTVKGKEYCVNWNMKTGRKCVNSPDCDKVHKCLRCDGSHRFCECTSRE